MRRVGSSNTAAPATSSLKIVSSDSRMAGSLVREAIVLRPSDAAIVGELKPRARTRRLGKPCRCVCVHRDGHGGGNVRTKAAEHRQLFEKLCTCSRKKSSIGWKFSSGLHRGGFCLDDRRPTHVASALTFPVTQIAHEAARRWRLDDDISELKDLDRQLQVCKNLKDKTAVLDRRKRVRGVFGGYNKPGNYVKPPVALAIRTLDDFDLYMLKVLVAIGQEQLLDWPTALLDVYAREEESNNEPESYNSFQHIFAWLGRAIEGSSKQNPGVSLQDSMPILSTSLSDAKLHLNFARDVDFVAVERSCKDSDEFLMKLLKVLVAALVRIEKFYDSIGGLTGYQLRALELIRDSEVEKLDAANTTNGNLTNDGFTNGNLTNGGFTNGNLTNGGFTNGNLTNGGFTNVNLTNGGFKNLSNGSFTNGGVMNGNLTDGHVKNGSLTNGSLNGFSSTQKHFDVPRGRDLSTEKDFAQEAASWGLEGLPLMGEIFPLGGAGDRLGLIDESTGECLPVAMLPYCGRTLLEGLIRDIQAREFLHYKVFGSQHITPVAIMTSAAKKNNERVRALCESHNWFGRGEDNFRLFEQPLVPTVAAADGRWLVTEPLQAIFKPGGHGVIWKLANDEGIFKWFYSKKRTAAIVRQISNPVAATDCTLLALSGIGLKYKKKLGFASCERTVGTAEGVNVLIESELRDGSREYAVSCIEYTEFKKLGILDVPVTPGSMQAQYPANTNVLFVDLPSVERLASSHGAASLPGMIMNLKKPVAYDDQFGNSLSVKAGRLECTMQNVADFLTNTFSKRLSPDEQWKLDTYVIYNARRKVTSSAKRRRKQGEHSLHQTPDGSFLDLTRNGSDILTYCGVEMPQMEGDHCYVDFGPPFVVLLHPALGPLWDITRQKIEGGSLAPGSELQLEIAEISWRDVQLDGSLLVSATNIMGSRDSNKDSVLQYGLRCGKCRLHNVQIKNRGIDWRWEKNLFWQNKIRRLETLEVILEDDAEFEASSVCIEGPHKFVVPKGHRMVVTSSASGAMDARLEPLTTYSGRTQESWFWKYELDANGQVKLTAVTS